MNTSERFQMIADGTHDWLLDSAYRDDGVRTLRLAVRATIGPLGNVEAEFIVETQCDMPYSLHTWHFHNLNDANAKFQQLAARTALERRMSW